MDIGHGKAPQKCIELGIALREIFRYIRYQFNELEWNLLMAGGNLTHLMADKQMALPGDKESRSCLFLLSRHFTPCQMDLRDILLSSPSSHHGLVNLRPRGLVTLLSNYRPGIQQTVNIINSLSAECRFRVALADLCLFQVGKCFLVCHLERIKRALRRLS